MPSSIELVPLALAACDPIDSVGAVLVDPSGAPVAGAKVRFGCDGEVVVSDASGKFTHERIPSIPSACTIDVEKDGFVPTQAGDAPRRRRAPTGAPRARPVSSARTTVVESLRAAAP